MYEELVNSLRYCATHSCMGEAPTLTGCTAIYDDAPKDCDSCNAVLQWQAADAIEELSKKRKTGEWCADYDGYSDGEPVYDMWWCSACGEYFDEWDDRPTWKYCPNCGAKMSGGDEDEEPPKEE